MASQVFNGTRQTSFTYTNNTGENVRIVINYLSAVLSISGSRLRVANGDLLIDLNNNIETPITFTIGRNLAFQTQGSTISTMSNNAFATGIVDIDFSLPTELMLEAGKVFSITGSNPPTGVQSLITRFSYNIVVIPEGG